MKTLKQISILFFMALAFTACSSDDDNNTEAGGGGAGGGSGSGNLTAVVDGQAFESESDLTQIQLLNGGSVLAITGPKAQETIQLNINAYNGVGTYRLMAPNVGSYGIVLDPNDPINSATTYIAIDNGELVVTEDTGSNMKGTFFFTGINPLDPSDSKVIENGSFNISY